MKKYTVTADIPEGYGGRIEFLIDRGKGFIPIQGRKDTWGRGWSCEVEIEDEETAIVRAVMIVDTFPVWSPCDKCSRTEMKDVIVGKQPQTFEWDIPKTHEHSKWQMETEVSDKHPMGKVNYVHIDEDSAYYTELQGILQEVQALHRRIISNDLKKGYSGFRLHGVPVHNASSAEEDVAYIIKGLENSIAKGYKIVDPVPEGYMTIVAPVGGYVVTPNMKIIPITADIFVELGFRFDGICWNHPDGLCIGYYKDGLYHVPESIANRGEKILYKHQVERLLNEKK